MNRHTIRTRHNELAEWLTDVQIAEVLAQPIKHRPSTSWVLRAPITRNPYHHGQGTPGHARPPIDSAKYPYKLTHGTERSYRPRCLAPQRPPIIHRRLQK